jgi:hypothetical protein
MQIGDQGMSYVADLSDPIEDVHDVVETFRIYGAVEPDWEAILSGAVKVLDEQLARLRSPGEDLRELADQLHGVLERGLVPDDPALDEVAWRVDALLRMQQLAGAPKPEDEDWAFH